MLLKNNILIEKEFTQMRPFVINAYIIQYLKHNMFVNCIIFYLFRLRYFFNSIAHQLDTTHQCVTYNML